MIVFGCVQSFVASFLRADHLGIEKQTLNSHYYLGSVCAATESKETEGGVPNQLCSVQLWNHASGFSGA